jgi:hypothetical protein
MALDKRNLFLAFCLSRKNGLPETLATGYRCLVQHRFMDVAGIRDGWGVSGKEYDYISSAIGVGSLTKWVGRPAGV